MSRRVSFNRDYCGFATFQGLIDSRINLSFCVIGGLSIVIFSNSKICRRLDVGIVEI